MGLGNKKIIVTGSSSGIGYSVFKELLSQGAFVTLMGRNRSKLDDIYKNHPSNEKERILIFDGDLTSKNEVERLSTTISNEWGAIDGLFANAGGGIPNTRGLTIGEDAWREVFRKNFFSTVLTVEALIDKFNHGSSILMTASIAGKERTNLSLAYGSAKAAVISYAKNLSQHLIKKGLRVNSISPGAVDIRSENPSYEQNLMKRAARPDELGKFICFLFSENCSFMTGTNIVVDGGETKSF